MTRKTGTYSEVSIAGQNYLAFVPYPLPPHDPPLDLSSKEDKHLLLLAERALARLDLMGEQLPSLPIFVYSFSRKEAVITSQIEGTQATLSDLVTAAAEDGLKGQNPDIEEITNYLRAVDFSFAETQKPKGLPISTRLLCEAHKILMQGVRGHNKRPGEIRRDQNYIGTGEAQTARYVPPPPQLLPDLLSALEKYVHSEDDLPPLVRIGLLHVQFEMIHPFVDGNGRIGRLLIALLLKHWGLLSEPLLYLSLFFKRNRREYYDRLLGVSAEGDWEGWLRYFLRGVAETANEAVDCAQRIDSLIAGDRNNIVHFPRSTITAVKLFELLPQNPALTIAQAAQMLNTSKPTAHSAVKTLQRAGILHEITGRKRARIFCYNAYVDILKEGTELDMHR